MKKILTLIAALGLALAAAAASNDSLRIYINAGHGSWGPNDRPMGTIPYPANAQGFPDTLGFFESNTNLWKCLQLEQTLIKMGVKPENIMQSRRLTGPYPYVKGASDEYIYNRPLSEICEEVEANNFDMFISIHSNAATDGSVTNYPLYLYRGRDAGTTDHEKTSRAMAQANWPYHYMDELDPQSAYSRTNMCVRGDWDFYGDHDASTRSNGKTYEGYLGVLKHGTPGYLLEGYFHTYQPARHRALNHDYCYQEGIRVARGICAYYGLNPETTGYIMGTVKDMHEKIQSSLFHYVPRSNDQWMPLNGALVSLYKDGVKVAEYQVDTLYNGLFVFSDLEPGQYTLDATLSGFKALNDEYKAPITVKANETSYTMIYLESESYTPEEQTYENYPEPVQPAYVSTPGSLNFTQESTAAFTMEGAVKRAVQHGDTTVVLTNVDAEPHLYLINNLTREVREMSTEGLTAGKPEGDLGFYSKLSDVAFTADGQLVGVNAVRCQFGDEQVDSGYTRGTLQFYLWEKLDQAPKAWVSTQSSANWYRADMGDALAVSGPAKACVLSTTGITSGTSRVIRVLNLQVEGGQVASTQFANTSANTNMREGLVGQPVSLVVSPNTDLDYVMDGPAGDQFAFDMPQTNNTNPTTYRYLASAEVPAPSFGANFFRYGRHSLMAAPFVNADTAVAGVKLFDVSKGLNQARLISTCNITPVRAAFMAAGGTVRGEDVILTLFTDKQMTRFTTVGVEQDLVKGILAYDLNSELNTADNSYTFRFKANSKAESAVARFYDKITGELVGEVPVTANEGENTFTLTQDQLPGKDQFLNWGIELTGKPISTIRLLNEANLTTEWSYTRTFNAVDNNPESMHFGNIYVSDYTTTRNSPANGVYMYTPDWKRFNRTAYNGGNVFNCNYRIGIDGEGNLYVPDWGDPVSGVYVVYPDSLIGGREGTHNFFQGSRSSDGLITNNGVGVGGSSPSAFVLGTGRNTRLYVYNEDIKINGSGNNVSIYNIGQKDGSIVRTWDKAPDTNYAIGATQLNTNGNIVADETGGCWVAQTRSAGNNNAGVPSLIYVDSKGSIVYNSGRDTDAEGVQKLTGSLGSGIAVSPDGKTFVINNGDGDLEFFDLTWQDGVPVLTSKYTYTASVRDGSKYIYEISYDYAGNLVVSGNQTGIYSMPTEDNRTYTPARRALEVKKGNAVMYNVTLTLTQPEHGSITGDEAGTYEAGTEVTLTAVPAEHYHFTQWSDGETALKRTVRLTQDTTLTAAFAVDQHELTLRVNNDAAGTVTGAGTYDYGTQVTLTATAAEHYHFTRWSDGNTDAERTFTVTEDQTLTAEFAIDRFTLVADANDQDMGEVTEGGTYDYGTQVTLTATPFDGYRFVSWSNGETTATITVTVTEDLTLIATFEVDDAGLGEQPGSVSFRVSGRTIILDNPAGQMAAVCTMTGQTISRSNTSLEVTVPAGVYLLRVGTAATKALVR